MKLQDPIDYLSPYNNTYRMALIEVVAAAIYRLRLKEIQGTKRFTSLEIIDVVHEALLLSIVFEHLIETANDYISPNKTAGTAYRALAHDFAVYILKYERDTILSLL